MRKVIFTLVAVFCVVGTTTADELDGIKVPIPKSDRVRNGTGVQCAWAAIETAGNYVGNKNVKNLTKNYKEEASLSVIKSVLNMRRVKAMLLTSAEDTREIDSLWIHEMIDRGYPVVSTLYGGHHMVVIVSYDHLGFRYIDGDGPHLEIRSISYDAFIRQWDGIALVVLKG